MTWTRWEDKSLCSRWTPSGQWQDWGSVETFQWGDQRKEGFLLGPREQGRFISNEEDKGIRVGRGRGGELQWQLLFTVSLPHARHSSEAWCLHLCLFNFYSRCMRLTEGQIVSGFVNRWWSRSEKWRNNVMLIKEVGSSESERDELKCQLCYFCSHLLCRAVPLGKQLQLSNTQWSLLNSSELKVYSMAYAKEHWERRRTTC